MTDLDNHIEAALATLEEAGIPRERVAIGITNERVKGEDTAYATFVGPTRDYDTAILLNLVIKDMAHESGNATTALIDMDETCPVCESPRYGIVSRADGPLRIKQLLVCMDCNHEQPYERERYTL
jgi:hypothetical protein